MIKVPLRSLHKRIEKAILDHDFESALTQSINILKYFPKNLDTYRLLGKMMLEKQDYLNAEKIFSVILRIDPDDFVANLGMSLVSESRGDIDHAVHYMERIFEIQPDNDPIQNEIKRLIHSRDGIDISKVKLTRGSLIHLYAQSDLVEQAIAEIRLGLHESPNRIDYRITLAKLLAKIGNHVEAVKTCIEIISQLPYCFSANQILDQILQSEDSGNKAIIHHQRLVELDPYYAFMSPVTSTVQDVPDIAVLVNDEPDNIEKILPIDWDWMIKTTWDEESEWRHESIVEDINWDSVIQEAIDSNANILEMSVSGKELEHERSDDPEKEELISAPKDTLQRNRKTILKSRLQKGPSSSPADSKIPGWIFDDEDEIMDQKTNAGDSLFQPNNHGHESIIDEQGVVDHDAPVEATIIEQPDLKTNGWIKDEQLTGIEDQSHAKTDLEDTKQIHVGRVDHSELLVSCKKAIGGGNIRYAIENLQNLFDQHQHDDEVIHLLEEVCHEHPDEIALWLKLGEMHLVMDNKEKALEIFKKAESKISL